MVAAVLRTGSAVAVFEEADGRVFLEEGETSSGDYRGGGLALVTVVVVVVVVVVVMSCVESIGSIPLLFSIVGFVEVCCLVAMAADDWR